MLCLHAQDFSKIMRPHYRWVVYAWGSEDWVRRGVFDDQQWAEAVARQSLWMRCGWIYDADGSLWVIVPTIAFR